MESNFESRFMANGSPGRSSWHVQTCAPSHPLVDVDLLPRTTELVYPRMPRLVDRGAGTAHRIPRWVPYEMVHTAYTLPSRRDGMFHRHLQRLASGNHLLGRYAHRSARRWRGRGHMTACGRTRYRVAPDRRRTSTIPAAAKALDRIDPGRLSAAIWDRPPTSGFPPSICRIIERRQPSVNHRT